jgi:hypothetical protein
MSSYTPPQPIPARSRASSSASMKYTPNNYNTGQPPTTPSAPMPIPSQGQPRGPAIAGQPISSTPPVRNTSYSSSPGYFGTTPPINSGLVGTPHSAPGLQGYAGTPQPPYPSQQLHPNYLGPSHLPSQTLSPVPDEDRYNQPRSAQRRASASSTRSRRSEQSERSRRSRRDSQRPSRRHSYDRHDDDRRDQDQQPRRHSDDRDFKRPTRRDTPRSFGGSIYSMLSLFKEALGPRDKY